MWKHTLSAVLLGTALGVFGCGGVEQDVDTATSGIVTPDSDLPIIPAVPGIASSPSCFRPSELFAVRLPENRIRLGWTDTCGAGPVVYQIQSREAVVPYDPPVWRNHFACGYLGTHPRVVIETEMGTVDGPFRVRTCFTQLTTERCKGVVIDEAMCTPYSVQVRARPCSGKGCLDIGRCPVDQKCPVL